MQSLVHCSITFLLVFLFLFLLLVLLLLQHLSITFYPPLLPLLTIGLASLRHSSYPLPFFVAIILLFLKRAFTSPCHLYLLVIPILSHRGSLPLSLLPSSIATVPLCLPPYLTPFTFPPYLPSYLLPLIFPFTFPPFFPPAINH